MSYPHGKFGPQGPEYQNQLPPETEKELKAYYEAHWRNNSTVPLTWEEWRKQYPQNIGVLMQYYQQWRKGGRQHPQHPEVLVGESVPVINDEKFNAAWNAWKTASTHPDNGEGI